MLSQSLQTDVSRETSEALEHYLQLLKKWSPKINLVAPNTLADAKTRHIEDSLQLLALAPEDAKLWADLGSGGGFPGLAVAIAAKQARPDLIFHLVESDQRKAVFLRTVSRETSTPVTVHAERIEVLPPLSADILSARALAPLSKLFGYVHRHRKSDGVALLMKGGRYAEEVADAERNWAFRAETVPSKTSQDAIVLKIGELTHV
ncbi:MAG: 16S rRNA (guanine(527)-N(7))-methyltransferase RsmG [Pseudomonadota bacterium]